MKIIRIKKADRFPGQPEKEFGGIVVTFDDENWSPVFQNQYSDKMTKRELTELINQAKRALDWAKKIKPAELAKKNEEFWNQYR